MAKYNKVTYSNSQAAIADSYSTDDSYVNDTLYLSVLTGDPGSATLYSIGTTDTTTTDLSGSIIVPTDLTTDTEVGADYTSTLGATIFMTSAGQVGYDMQPIAALIDGLAAGQVLADSFYYAIEMAGGTISWNTATVDIYGLAADIGVFQEAGFVTEATNWQSPPESATDTLSDGGAIAAFAASGNLTSIAVTAASGDQGTLTLDPGGATYDGDIGALAYHFSYTVSEELVYETHTGYGEKAFTDAWTITTANGTTQSLSEDVYGNIHAPDLTASAAQSSITEGGSVGLSIAASDNDDNALLTYAISGVPTGATLSSAADAGGVSFDPGTQTWTVAAAALGDLTLTPGAGFTGQIDLTVTVTNTEANPNNSSDVATASTAASIGITVNPRTTGYGFTILDAPGALWTAANGINGAGQIVGATSLSGQPYYNGWEYAGSQFLMIAVSGAGNTNAEGINNPGLVSGYYEPAGASTPRYGYTDDGGAFTLSISLPPGISTTVTGINDEGVFVGSSYLNGGNFYSGYIDDNGAITILDAPGTTDTEANGINDQGDVVGSYGSVGGLYAPHGFLYRAGVFTTIDDPLGVNGTVASGINNRGEIVGYFYDSTGKAHGFLDSGGTFTTIDDPLGVRGTYALGINDADQIVGQYADSSGIGHGYLADPPPTTGYNYTTLDDPAASSSPPITEAFAIKDAGQIAGWYADSTWPQAPSQHGFLYGNGTFTTIDDPFATQGTVVDNINDAGQVIGSYGDSAGGHGFLYSNGSYTTIDDPAAVHGTHLLAVNDGGEIAGYYDDASNDHHGFLFGNGTFTAVDDPLAAAQGTLAWDINDAGHVVGHFYDAAGGQHGFLYSGGTYTTIDDPAANNFTIPEAINNADQIVGTYTDAAGQQHGFLYSLSSGTYTAIDDPLATGGTVAKTINDSGEIAGTYNDNSGTHVFVYRNGSYTTIDDPSATMGTFLNSNDGGSPAPHALNNAGQLAGFYHDGSGYHGFLAVPT